MAEKKPEGAAPEAPPAGGGGFKAWLPLIVTLVAMPALAFGTMNFLILPKMQKAAAGGKPAADAKAGGGHEGGAAAETGSAEAGGHGEAKAGEAAAEESKPAAGGHGGGSSGETSEVAGAAKSKTHKLRFEKVIVNVAGTSGTRYIMATLVLAGTSSKLKDPGWIEDNKDQLMDIATSTLGTKTIADLEKPGARAQIKIELMSVFNTALGQNIVKEVFIPEWAIQ